ncbi:MAG: hypothetical protein DCC75_08580 [Proteobacteria bacterium]|nr:MAG: hypothetical protein DCC75_08580 [Pseudomonadota bacterium]
MSERKSDTLNATLVERKELTPELLQLFIRPDAPPAKFIPGQYVAIGLPGSAPRPPGFPEEEIPAEPGKMIKLAYSIGSSPDDPSVLEFYLAVLPQGALTSRIVSLKPGDRLFMAPKVTGTFTLEGVPEDHNLMLVSTGTGIAPYISMLRSKNTWTPGRKISIVHGVRYESDLAYKEELSELANSHSSFSYYNIVSRPGAEWRGEKGYVQRYFQEERILLDPGRDHVYLCGNPGMIDQMEEWLLSKGYKEHSRKQPGNLHLERYW